MDAGNVSLGECHRFYIFLLDTGDHDVLTGRAERTKCYWVVSVWKRFNELICSEDILNIFGDASNISFDWKPINSNFFKASKQC